MASSCRTPGSGTWSSVSFDGACPITGVIGVPCGGGLRAAFVIDRPSAILATPSWPRHPPISRPSDGPLVRNSRLAVGLLVAWSDPIVEFKNKDLKAVNGMRCRVVQTEHHMLASCCPSPLPACGWTVGSHRTNVEVGLYPYFSLFDHWSI